MSEPSSAKRLRAVASRIAWFLAVVATGPLSLAGYEYLTGDPVDGELLGRGIPGGIGTAIAVEIIRLRRERRERRDRDTKAGHP